MAQFVEFSSDANTVSVTGDWTLGNIDEISAELETAQKKPAQIDATIGHMDTAGAQALGEFAAGNAITGLDARQSALMELVAQEGLQPDDAAPPQGAFIDGLTEFGQAAVDAWHNAVDLISFMGETVVNLSQAIIRPRHLRFSSIARHIRETGLNAIPIVALIAFLISIVLAYQGAGQLKRFGAEIFTINMVAVSVLREMGVLLTAIMIAGRSGSAFTAEIGVMKVNEEVDAMRIIGVSPFDMLVLPRVIALMVTLPLLAFIADLMGLLGGGIISYALLDISIEQYVERLHTVIKMRDFWVGIIKAPVFAFFIAIVACMRGMQVSGSAESIGRLTTTSVVQSIFMVLLMDALFSILFSRLGI